MFSETVLPAALSDTQDKIAVPHRVYVYAACTVLAIAWNYVAGKEMAWDLLHYHFYAGFSALNGRFAQDYFAAGPQSYFNPYAYVPFYALVRLGLPALVVGTVMAMIHSVVLWITYELACSVCPSKDPKTRLFFGLCATALACLNPVLLQQIGSSFADITTAGLVLGGWLLLIYAVRRPNTKFVILAAALLGLATALKLTNSVHVLAGFFVLAFVPLPFLGRILTLFYFGAALGTSFVFAAAPWSYRLVKMFGNPMFPLLNNIFQSPEFTTASLKHYRFIPDSLIDALLRPFATIGTSGMIDVELPAPDIRYALLLSVFLLFIIASAWRSIRGTSTPVANLHPQPETRALAALGCGFTAAWVIWLSGSGNGRYFIPMSCVAAVLAVAILFRLLANHSTGRNSLLLTLLVAQGAQVALSDEHRWSKAPWGGYWFNVDIPEKLTSQPNLYLTIGMQSNSFIAPFLAKGSGFANFSGGYVLGPDGANALRVRALISGNTPHLRVLVSGDRIYKDSEFREPRQSDVDDALRIFDLRVDMSDCETLTVRGSPASVWRPLESSVPAVIVPRNLRYASHLVSCHLVADTRDQTEETEARRAADIVLDRLEDACPALFQPRRPQTEHINQMWLRVYPSTDLSAWVGHGEVKFIDPTRGVRHGIVVGREEEWEKEAQSLECGRQHGIYFARSTQVRK
jgi:hypothetical protein